MIAQQLDVACLPCPSAVLIDRLTALGMSMAPNRPQAEASVWLHETARLLNDLPQDIVLPAIDDLQKRLKFLPTVAEIRALADPIVGKRRKLRSRADAMVRYLESGQPIPTLAAHAPQRPQRRDEPITEAELVELNAIMERAGLSTRYRPDGSQYQEAVPKGERRKEPRPRRQPSRQDYIDMGVDPAVLDRIAAESAQAQAR